MNEMTGAQILWECLVREGVTTVFGYPGGAILPAYDAMLDYPIRHVLVRHEQGATHMADGYARASGKVGVAIATSGPGATNMVTGIATAMMDSLADRLHHRPGRQQADRLRRVSGDRHHRRHPADHQAQLPGDARRGHRAGDPRGVLHRRDRAARGRCWSTSRRTRSRRRASSTGTPPRREPGIRGPTHRATPTASPRALELINAAERPVILAGHGIMLAGAIGRRAGVRRKGADPGRDDAARHRRLPGVASAEPRHDGHARRGVGEHRDSGSRPADRARHALRRSRHRQPEDLRAERARRSTSTSTARRSTRTCASTSALVGDLARVAAAMLAGRRRRRPHAVARRTSTELKGDSAVRDIQNLPDDGHLYAAHVINDLWRRHRGQRDRRHRRRPAPDVGGAVLPARPAAHAHHLGRPRHDGLRAARGDRRQARAPRRRSLGGRRRRRLPDDDAASWRRSRRRSIDINIAIINNGYPRHGAPVAGVLLRAAATRRRRC